MRNTAELIKQGNALMRERPRLDITAGEINAIIERNAGGDLFTTLMDFYLAGVAIGYRMEKKPLKER